jgi:hypothetical protein
VSGPVLAGALMGLVATAAMDVWALILNRFAGQNLPNWALVGRWFRRLADGVVFHDDIAAAERYERELALGWIGHYAIGIVYGVVFALIAGPDWLAAPTFLPAWIFALLTVAAGWFLLQPGLGLGWAASRTANPAKVRALNLVAHTVFGLGLWLTALGLAA